MFTSFCYTCSEMWLFCCHTLLKHTYFYLLPINACSIISMWHFGAYKGNFKPGLSVWSQSLPLPFNFIFPLYLCCPYMAWCLAQISTVLLTWDCWFCRLLVPLFSMDPLSHWMMACLFLLSELVTLLLLLEQLWPMYWETGYLSYQTGKI